MACEMKYEEFVAKMDTYDWKIGVGALLRGNGDMSEWIPNVKTWKCNSFEKLLKKLLKIKKEWNFPGGDLSIYYRIPTGSKYLHVRNYSFDIEFDNSHLEWISCEDVFTAGTLWEMLILHYENCDDKYIPLNDLSYLEIKQLR